MGLFLEIAAPLSQLGIPVTPLREKTKIAFLSGWESSATADLNQVMKWSMEYPQSNCGCVARAAEGQYWFFEIDSPDVVRRVLEETGHQLSEIKTFMARSSPGKGHFYFRQNSASILMGNISQKDVKGSDWSARVHNQYVVAPGSIHPKTGLPYETLSKEPIIEAPQWLIDWCQSQKKSKKEIAEELAGGESEIPEHHRNDTLASIGGSLRNKGLDYDQILLVLKDINEKRCSPPLPATEVETIAGSVSRYKKGDPLKSMVIVGGRIVGAPEADVPPAPVAEEVPTIEVAPYPRFPRWVMQGTSVYEGLVKPFCDVNTRYPEFMFMPSIALLLNYVGGRVRVESKDLMPSMFMVAIGRAGRVIKSSCVQDAIKYFEFMGCVGNSGGGVNNANGKALVFTIGSPEGFGKEMNRLHCRNGVLFYDELRTLTDKASIENSNLSASLLTLYESGNFQNIVKNPKDSFALQAGTYCASLIACCTDKNFSLHWSKMSGKSSGLNDRFFFLLQPEALDDIKPYVHVATQEASVQTRQLIDKAITKGVYSIADHRPFNLFLKKYENSNRAAIRAEKLALYFAIDLDREEIDEECIERAIALVEYEMKVKKYLRVYEAASKEGGLQMEILATIRMKGGRIELRDLERNMNSVRFGTTMWNASFNGLVHSGYIRVEGRGVKGDPKVVQVLRLPEDDEK